MDTSIPPVKKSISSAQFAGAFITVLAIVVGFYTQTQVRFHDLELRMSSREQHDQDASESSKEEFGRINMKLDALQVQMNDIKVELVNKADRKN